MSFTTEQILFLINPNSGSGKQSKILAKLKKENTSFNYFVSNRKKDLELFFANLDKRFKVVVICGGDGTLNSILKYIVNSHLTIAVLPTGSGNGFAREMGYTNEIDKLLAAIKRGETRKVDVLKINDDYCINVAGIGFDGFIAYKFDQNSERGLLSYVKESIKGFFKFQAINASINVNGVHLSGDYFMLTMANTRQFGNNIVIAPNAQANDGLIELVLIKKFPKICLPAIIIKLLFNRGKNSKYIEYIKTKSVSIKTDYINYHIDGEPLILKNNIALTASIESSITIIDSIKTP